MNACYSLEPTYENKMAGFVEYQCSVGQGVQGYVGSALKNNVVQAGLVFDVVLYLPSISRSSCLIQKFCRNLKHKFLAGRSKLHF